MCVGDFSVSGGDGEIHCHSSAGDPNNGTSTGTGTAMCLILFLIGCIRDRPAARRRRLALYLTVHMPEILPFQGYFFGMNVNCELDSRIGCGTLTESP